MVLLVRSWCDRVRPDDDRGPARIDTSDGKFCPIGRPTLWRRVHLARPIGAQRHGGRRTTPAEAGGRPLLELRGGRHRRRRRLRGPGARRQGRLRPPQPPWRGVRAQVTASTSSYLRADAVEILTPSPDRVVAPVPARRPRPLWRLRLPARGDRGPTPPQGLPHRRTAGTPGRTRAGRRGGTGARGTPTAWPSAPGCAWRSTAGARWGSVATAPTAWNTSDECPIASPAVSATGALEVPVARRHRSGGGDRDGPGRDHGLRDATASIGATPARPRARRRRRGGRQGPATPRGRARRRRRPHLPDFARCLLAGSRRRGGGAALGGPRTGGTLRGCGAWPTSTPARACSRFPWPRRWARRAPSWPSSGTDRACADARHNGATFPNLRVLEGDVTPALVESALGPARHRRARPGPRGRRDRGHGRSGRPRGGRAHADLRLVRSGFVRARRSRARSTAGGA